jgi:hypothetical protein
MTRVKKSKSLSIVMAGLDPAIQEKLKHFNGGLDGRVKHGHDEGEAFAASILSNAQCRRNPGS